MNEFRQALTDQTSTFPTRVELRAVSDAVVILRDEVTKLSAEIRGATSARATLFAIGGLVIAAISAGAILLR